MSDSEQDSTTPLPILSRINNNFTERTLYIAAIVFAIFVAGLAMLFALISFNFVPTIVLYVCLQVALSLIVLAFCLVGDPVIGKSDFINSKWLLIASILAAIIFVISLFAGEYLLILLAPLFIGLAQHLHHQKSLILVGLACIALISFEHLILALINWNNYLISTDLNFIPLVFVIITIPLSLATMLRLHQIEIIRYQEEQENKASEMEVAHDIQTALMPPSEIITGEWSMFARSIPAKDVGGDFYEYIPYLDLGIGGVAIGDVAGKGIPAALQMAVVRTLFRVEARRRIFPGDTLMSINMALQAERSFGMVTLLYCFVDQASSTLHLSNAGHNYPIILNETLSEVRLPGLPLGIDDGIEYEEKQVYIAPGTSVILYTDGVIEAMNCEGDLYGFSRLQEAVLNNRNKEPEELVKKILEDVAVFTENAPQSDDITVVIIHHHLSPVLQATSADEPVENREKLMAVAGQHEDEEFQ